jgi:polar amino acid transport system permease protein
VGYALDFSWLRGALGVLAQGALMSVLLTAVATFIGLFLSILGASARKSRFLPVRFLVSTYVELIRNTPFLVQLFFIYFGLPSIGIMLNPIVSAILALTINLAAYGIMIVGAGLDAVPVGQREAGRALGLGPVHIFVKIILPQAMKVIFPALTSQMVISLLDSAVVSQIAVRDLTYEGDMLQARTFRAFETYFVVTLIYLALTVLLRRTMLFVQARSRTAGAR